MFVAGKSMDSRVAQWIQLWSSFGALGEVLPGCFLLCERIIHCHPPFIGVLWYAHKDICKILTRVPGTILKGADLEELVSHRHRENSMKLWNLLCRIRMKSYTGCGNKRGCWLGRCSSGGMIRVESDCRWAAGTTRRGGKETVWLSSIKRRQGKEGGNRESIGFWIFICQLIGFGFILTQK